MSQRNNSEMRTSLAQLLRLQSVLLDSAILHGPGGSSSCGRAQVGDSLVSTVRGDKNVCVCFALEKAPFLFRAICSSH